jgi:Uma2 family endonuclease
MNVDVVRRRFTADQYLRMIDTGILAKGDRVELIEGEILEMGPTGPPHGAGLANLNRLLVLGVGSGAIVMPGATVRLSALSAPEPDLMLLRPRQGSYRDRYIEPGDVLLIVEVSDTSLRRDRELKLPLYARAGIPEVWIADVQDQRVEVYRSPGPGAYASVRRIGQGESIAPVAFPDLVISVDEVFV